MWNRIGSTLWDGLIALLTAATDQFLELPACLLLGGLLMRRERHQPIGPFDLGTLGLLLVVAGLLVRRIVRSPKRPMDGWGLWAKTPAGTVGPTVSWAHFAWGGAWLWVGSGLWTITDASLPGARYHGFGLGFLIVAGAFILLRGIVGVRRYLDDREN